MYEKFPKSGIAESCVNDIAESCENYMCSSREDWILFSSVTVPFYTGKNVVLSLHNHKNFELEFILIIIVILTILIKMCYFFVHY